MDHVRDNDGHDYDVCTRDDGSGNIHGDSGAVTVRVAVGANDMPDGSVIQRAGGLSHSVGDNSELSAQL